MNESTLTSFPLFHATLEEGFLFTVYAMGRRAVERLVP